MPITGLDYADQRFYASTYGRFNTPDPYMARVGPADPRSWNRYAYTRGDPANRFDLRGLEDEDGAYGGPQEEVGDDGDHGDLGGGGGSGDPCTVLAFQNPTAAPCISAAAPIIPVATSPPVAMQRELSFLQYAGSRFRRPRVFRRGH
jgi:RHS repeat-associated protein